MKKQLLFLLVLAAAAESLAAGNPQKFDLAVHSPKHITDIRAGLNTAWMTAKAEGISANTPNFLSAHIGISDQLRLTIKRPELRLEYGLYFTSKGGKIPSDDNSPSQTFHPFYLQIPLLINYRIRFGNHFTAQPFGGVYYAFGIAGKCFGKYGAMSHSDFGIRIGLGAAWKKLYLGFGYEKGLIDIRKWRPQGTRFSTNCVTVSLGYNFSTFDR